MPPSNRLTKVFRIAHYAISAGIVKSIFTGCEMWNICDDMETVADAECSKTHTEGSHLIRHQDSGCVQQFSNNKFSALHTVWSLPLLGNNRTTVDILHSGL